VGRITGRVGTVGCVLAALAGVPACSSARHRASPVVHTRHAIPVASSFQVVQVLSRTSPAPTCHTLPTTFTCLKVGPQIGTRHDVQDVAVVPAQFPQRWNLVVDIDAGMKNRINQHLHEQLAFVIGGSVPAIVEYSKPVGDSLIIAGEWTDHLSALRAVIALLASRN
jgi:hypothetical protein